MASRDDYAIGWVCALPIEAAAAKATLDHVYNDLLQSADLNDSNNYILGAAQGQNVVVAFPRSGVYGQTSIHDVVTRLHASYPSVRFVLVVGIAGGVPGTKEDIRLGDVVVSKSIAGSPGVVQLDANGEQIAQQPVQDSMFDQSTSLLLAAMGKAETAAIFNESKVSRYIREIVEKDPAKFVRPDPGQDCLFEPTYNHDPMISDQSSCVQCNPDKIQVRKPRGVSGPVVHHGRIASVPHLMRDGSTRDAVARTYNILCFDTETSGLENAAQYLVIRGICDYADSHSSEVWQAYSAAAATAYAKEVLSFLPKTSKAAPLAMDWLAEAAPVLDALLLTRPEVDRKSLIALKGRRVDGTCEWLMQHPHYQDWLASSDNTLLWISGGPGKGKTMLSIYITEMMQPIVDADDNDNVLLYYFCSNRDKNRNTALTIMRGILHQWLNTHPHLVKYVKSSFEGTETTKYTTSSFILLWRVFVTLLQQTTSSQVVCVLDGLDECEKESLRQLLDAIGIYLSRSSEKSRPQLKFIILSRPQPAILENKLGQYPQIQLDAAGTEISQDVEKYIFARVAELASEQNLSDDMVAQVQQTLLAGADGTFLWVGFVANELQGSSLSKINEVLRNVPRGLGGVYQRLLQQISDKEAVVSILQWVVLAARPLTLEELAIAADVSAANGLPATQVTRNQLRFGGLLVKVEGGVVNLVHESAKEFFQSEQVNIKGIDMFLINYETHKALLHRCLSHIERGFGGSEGYQETTDHDPFLSYASQYWPVHFHHAIHAINNPSELAHPFFQPDSTIRDEWWKVFWELEKNGGSPPTFTLLHLAAYFGNVPWADMLINQHSNLISRKDNYGRTPIYWAVNQGHQEMVELLLAHGAKINFKDRSILTALHIAVSGQHKDVVSVLLDHGADIEAKAEYGDTDTPLIRAILANSSEIVEELLEHGARVDYLPDLLGVSSLRKATDPVEDRAKELLELQEQVFLARFKRSSRFVDTVMKGLGLSLRFPLVLKFMSLYLKFVALNRWNSLSVLQELVQDNKTEELREWAKLYNVFFLGLVVARTAKRLKAMGDLSTQILEKVAPRDLQALLAITVFTGMETKLTALQHGWTQGDAITAAAISDWASIACERDALEFFHFGIREFLSDFDRCVRDEKREESILRATLLLTGHFAMLKKQDSGPIEYFSRVVAEFFEGYIGSSYEVSLFSDMNQACANELLTISEKRDAARLHLLLTSILHFAQQAQEKGQGSFLSVLSAACLTLCQRSAATHQWLIGEAIPNGIAGLIAKEQPVSLQKRIAKSLVECLIIGQQYSLALPRGAPRQRVEQQLQSVPGVVPSIDRILGP